MCYLPKTDEPRDCVHLKDWIVGFAKNPAHQIGFKIRVGDGQTPVIVDEDCVILYGYSDSRIYGNKDTGGIQFNTWSDGEFTISYKEIRRGIAHVLEECLK